jgi:hypothetical protein
MGETGPGCRKVSVVGCLGAFGLLLLAVGISAFWAWRIQKGESVEDASLSAPHAPHEVTASAAGEETQAGPVGRIVLGVSDAGLRIHPGVPGEPTRIETTFDEKVYHLEERVERGEAGFWVYTVRFHRSAPVLVSLFHQLMGGEEALVDVYLSPDEPIELELNVEQAGVDAELAGLWITRLSASARQAGGRVGFAEPLRAPMEMLDVRTAMGGFELVQVANASPRALALRCRMGGVELDLDGTWAQDLDVDVDVLMGGIEVALPSEVDVEGLEDAPDRDRLRVERPEVLGPTLRFNVKARMGGVDVR